jgi:GH25 family lysozyme M1 (1,4-beta-N-acetylmuramidase)
VLVRRAVASLALASLVGVQGSALPGMASPRAAHPHGSTQADRGHASATHRANHRAGHDIALATPTQPTFIPTGGVRGIDVSHYQGRIDWQRVAAAGYRFVFAKATEGVRYVDPTYVRNKTGAEREGLVFGAYHFANPDARPNDAVREANHFLDRARLIPGNIVPVLDLETTGGLSHRRLTHWILTWMRHVRDRLGVRPILYTSPLGWQLRTGDTATIARAGYEQLWVAHWGVEEPTVPAGHWDRHGWTFWQRSECGSVPGVGGCVDVDIAGKSLDVTTIPTGLDVRSPTVRVGGIAGVADPIAVAFDEAVDGVWRSSAQVRAADGTPVRVRRACASDYGTAISCATAGVRSVTLIPIDDFVPGETYEVIVRDVSDAAGNAVGRTVSPLNAPTELEQGSAAIRYSWAQVDRDNATGGSYAVERRPRATATFGFRGPTVTWLTAKGLGMGVASVAIDGQRQGTFDLRSRASAFGVGERFDGLGPGAHEITITVLGGGGGEAPVIVDGFRLAHGVVPSPTLETTWATRDTDGARTAASAITGASAELTFRGTGLVWHTIAGPEHGRAAIWVDDSYVRTYDTGSSTHVADATAIRGLDDGLHTVRIVVLGSAAASDGDTAAVAVDGFTVLR